MKRAFLIPVASLAFAAAFPIPQANAGNGFGVGLFSGLVAGTAVGVLATQPYYYAPAPVYVAPVYGPPVMYVGPRHVWAAHHHHHHHHRHHGWRR
jgi:hypothetical protein